MKPTSMMISVRSALLLLTFALLTLPTTAFAQRDVPASKRLHTDVNFELLMPRARPNGLASQRWVDVFRKYGASVRIRQPLFNDEVGV